MVSRRKIGMLVGAFNQEMALVGRSLLCDYRQASCGPLFEARLLADQSRASVREKGGDISMNLCVHCNCPSRGTAHSSFQNSMNKYVKEIFFLKCEILKVVIYMSPVSLFGHHINHFQAGTCVSMLSRQCRYLLLVVTFSGSAGNLDTIATAQPLIDQSGGTQL